MKKIVLLSGLLLGLLSVDAQVSSASGAARDGSSIRRQKDIPVNPGPLIQGNGQPTKLYVIQLARFESMNGIPSTFPKGTFLWVNPDHRSEMLLLAGFYDDPDKAYAASKQWKKKAEFKKAFVRAKPFMVRYD